MVNHDISSGAQPVRDTFIDDFACNGPWREPQAPTQTGAP